MSVIALLDRFTFSAVGGAPAMYSPWVQVPAWCRSSEVLFECFSFNGGGPVDLKLESSMDMTETEGLATESLSSATVTQASITQGLARYARVKLTAQGTVAVNMVVSAHLILRTAE